MAGFAKYLDSTADEVHAVIHAGREPFVKSNFFIRLLQSALPIHFGLHLMEDATFQPQKPFKPSIPGEQIVKRQRSSFVVAADGTFSCGEDRAAVSQASTDKPVSPMATGSKAKEILSISVSGGCVSPRTCIRQVKATYTDGSLQVLMHSRDTF